MKKSGGASKKLSQSYVKNTLKKGYKFLFENDCHDDCCRLTSITNRCRGDHSVKCSCTEGGNGYCNHMFLLYNWIHWIPKNRNANAEETGGLQQRNSNSFNINVIGCTTRGYDNHTNEGKLAHAYNITQCRRHWRWSTIWNWWRDGWLSLIWRAVTRPSRTDRGSTIASATGMNGWVCWTTRSLSL